MSIFNPVMLACPQCKTPVEFQAVHSVNADRRPDLRTAILRGEFQRKTCPACGAGFRLDPSFIYVNLARNQWVAAQPVTAVDEWDEREVQTRALFAASYGVDAPPVARSLGAKLVPRLVFGWSALREKLIAAEAGLDDVSLELLKMGVMRNAEGTTFSPDTTLRLMDFEPKRLLMGWVRNPDDAVGDLRWVARELYDDIVADADKGDEALWSDVRAEFDGALFVDVDRLMVHT
jgi:hypothetical protein